MSSTNSSARIRDINSSIDASQAALVNSQRNTRAALAGADISPALERNNLAASQYSRGDARVSLGHGNIEVLEEKRLRKLQNELTKAGGELDVTA